jgi:uncharacterized protein (DUF4415 family)
MKQKSLTNKKGEVRTLTRKDFRSMKPINEVLPKSLVETIAKRKRGERGEQKSPKKIPMSIRISPMVVKHFKSIGPGWQAEINSVLEGHVKRCTARKKHDAHTGTTTKSYAR